MGQLKDRVAIVTGAGEGIGRGFARVFAAEGAHVVIGEINAALGEQTAGEIAAEFGVSARSIATDVADRAQVEALVAATVEEHGRLDILVNNAWGGGELSRVEHKTDALLDHGLHVGFYGPVWAMQAAFPTMKAARYGRIVNICSLNGVNAHMGTVEYNSAKEALRAFTRTAAREWAPLGITANIICPAAKSAAFHRVMSQHPELIAAADGANPMGRVGDPETDIAPVAVFLASEGARYVTGNTIFADGGSHINGSAWAPDLPE